MNYEIVKYRPEFKSQIIELQKHLLIPDAAMNAAHLEWKYERNPYIDTPLIYLALCGGQVVGMRGMYGTKWQIGNSGQTFIGLCSGDAVIAPDHRTRGLYKKLSIAHLNELANRGYTYTFALSPNMISRRGLLTIGYHSIGYMRRMRWTQTRQRKIPNRVRKYASKVPFLPSLSNLVHRQMGKLPILLSVEKRNPFYFLDRNCKRRLSKTNPNLTVQQTPRPKEMTELVKRIVSDGRIRHIRDQQYFAWRFNNPLSCYRFLFWEESGLKGYLILQTPFNNNTLTVNIVDWEATNPQVRSDLLEAALHLGNFDSLSIWTATLPDVVKVLLEKNGFKVLDEAAHYQPVVLVRPVRDDMLKTDWIIDNRRLLDLANWDLPMIYSDEF